MSEYDKEYDNNLSFWSQTLHQQDTENDENVCFSTYDSILSQYLHKILPSLFNFSQSVDIYTWLESDCDTENENVKRN